MHCWCLHLIYSWTVNEPECAATFKRMLVFFRETMLQPECTTNELCFWTLVRNFWKKTWPSWTDLREDYLLGKSKAQEEASRRPAQTDLLVCKLWWQSGCCRPPQSWNHGTETCMNCQMLIFCYSRIFEVFYFIKTGYHFVVRDNFMVLQCRCHCC